LCYITKVVDIYIHKQDATSTTTNELYFKVLQSIKHTDMPAVHHDIYYIIPTIYVLQNRANLANHNNLYKLDKPRQLTQENLKE